jgi:hypothetical protein
LLLLEKENAGLFRLSHHLIGLVVAKLTEGVSHAHRPESNRVGYYYSASFPTPATADRGSRQ